MSERVIEPSEIIVEQPGRAKENITHVNPWIRCIARFFDYSLFFTCIALVRKQFPFGPYEHWIPFEPLVWIPFEALFLTLFGTTPGKWFLKTKLKQGRRTKFEWMSALRRSFAVWFRGLGMGIPVINCFCLMVAYQKLKIFSITSWDRDDHVQVTHYPIGKWRIYIAVFVAATGILYYYSGKNKELKNVVRSIDEYSPSGRITTRSDFST